MGGWWDSVDAVAKFNTWMQVSIVVFGIFTAAATALTIVASNRIASLQSAESARMREELKLTTEKLAVAGEAIEAAKGQAGEARAAAAQVATQDVFRPLAEPLRSEVQSALSGVRARFHDHPATIKVACEAGNSSRQLVCQQLAELLRSATFAVEGPNPTTTMSTAALPPFRVSVHPADHPLADSLIHALSPFLRAGFAGTSSENWTRGLIEIHVYGLPVFNPDGSLELR